MLAERRLELGARRDVKLGEPTAQREAEQRGQARLFAEIDDMELAAGRDGADRARQRLAPGQDHRQTVGGEDALEARNAEQRLRIERGRVSLRQSDAAS